MGRAEPASPDGYAGAGSSRLLLGVSFAEWGMVKVVKVLAIYDE